MKNLAGLIAVIAAAGVSLDASAATTILNNNSSATFDFNTSAGMTSWLVDGVNQANQQTFFYRLGSSGPQQNVSTISTPTLTPFLSRQITALYSNSQVGVKLSYALSGQTSGSGQAGMNETITLFNYTAVTQAFHFFMYSDFTLGGPSQAGSQSVVLGTDTNGTSTSVQTFGNPGNNSVSAITPANHLQASLGSSLYNSLNTSLGYVLNDNPTAGPGAAKWGWEWDFNIAPNTSSQVSILDSIVVPEPGTVSVGIIGLSLLAMRLRRQRNNP